MKVSKLLQSTKSLLTRNLTNKKLWLSFLLGVSLVFAYAPFSQWWLTLAVLPLFLNILRNQTPKNAFKYGLSFSFGWFSAGISWVHVSIDQFGGLPLAVSILLMILLCLYLALYPAFACYFSSRFSAKKQSSLWLLLPLWLCFEYFRATFLTGFPWLSLGYSQVDSPLSALAPVIGEIGLTAVVLLISVSVIELIKTANKALNLTVLISVLFATLLANQSQWVKPQDKTTRVALVQGNIEQSMKWQPDQEWPTMLKYLDHTRNNYDADIIIWPESAITALEPEAQDFLRMADKAAALNNSAIITGILNYDFESREYFNNLVTVGKRSDEQPESHYYFNHKNRYSKNHLLPIGEFVPLGNILRKIAPLFNLNYSDFSRGEYKQDNLEANNLFLLPLICFEIAFPQQLAANFTEQTDAIITVSNDSWFGDSHGPHQHLDIARMRALEFGRPVFRATNNGVTAVVDHQGNIQEQLPQFTEAVLKTDVQIVSGFTPYSQYAAFSHLLGFIWLGAFFSCRFLFYRLLLNKEKSF